MSEFLSLFFFFFFFGGGGGSFRYGSMGNHFEALAPQYVVSWNSVAADPAYSWYNASHSAAQPSAIPTSNAHQHATHSPWAQFSATCMYFGAELIAAREAQGLEAVPVGLIQSAIGGSQIEAWMDNQTRTRCRNQSLSGGAVPQDNGRLYYGMTAPFVNYSVAGWLWYQASRIYAGPVLPRRCLQGHRGRDGNIGEHTV